MKILLTGATGFVGGAVAAELALKGLLAQTVFMVRASTQQSALDRVLMQLRKFDIGPALLANLKPEQMICADLADLESIQTASTTHSWQGITHVIHCAAIATFSNNPQIWQANVGGTLALAQAIWNQGKQPSSRTLKRWIQVGTAMCCGPDLTSPVIESWELGQDEASHIVPYTRSKIAAEMELKAMDGFPLVVARPSIVVGHSQLGCTPSPSIFWVFRMAMALERFTCAIDERIDVISVDDCAHALVALCFKPELAHDLYHVSAGEGHSPTFAQIDQAYADAQGTAAIGARYQQVAVDNLRSLVPLFQERLGKVNRILVLQALTLYGAFAKLNYVFSNRRLIAEGIQAPRAFTNYVDRCIFTSENSPIIEQMRYDFK